MDKLDICKNTKKIASDSLTSVLEEVLSKKRKISELEFRDLWLKKQQKYSDIFPNGWYDPPPYGIEVLFVSKEHPNRADFVNLRPKEHWPKDDVFLDFENGYAYLFSSPVDRKYGIAGDFAINIYFGDDEKNKENIQRSLKLDLKIFEFIEEGMSFAEIFDYADLLITKEGLRNNIFSVTDPNHSNIGHTIPFSYENISNANLKIADDNWNEFTNLISKKRIFLSGQEQFKVKGEMAFTIEPALKVQGDDDIPMTMLHNTILINENGEKEIVNYFNEIFNLVGMEYMLNS